MSSIEKLLPFLFLSTIKAQNICTDSRATCINIRECPFIIEISKEKGPLSDETVENIRKLRCGTEENDPMICCNLQDNRLPQTTMKAESSSQAENNIPDPLDVTNHPNLRLLDHENCGPVIPQNVLGSRRARIFDYPWMALLVYNTTKPTNESSQFLCRGTIISSRYILTTATCVTPLPAGFREASPIGVRVGDRDIDKERDCDTDFDGQEVQCAERYQEFGIDSIHFNLNFNKMNLHNDVALIRLNDTIDFGPFNIRPICLPFGTASTLNQEKGTVSGWNIIIGSMRAENVLLQVKLPLVSNEQCEKIYNIDIWHAQICAGGQLVGPCYGDSGVPLQAPGIYNGNSTRTIQYGILSFGTKVCPSADPYVFTRISSYMNWILSTMRD